VQVFDTTNTFGSAAVTVDTGLAKECTTCTSVATKGCAVFGVANPAITAIIPTAPKTTAVTFNNLMCLFPPFRDFCLADQKLEVTMAYGA
jgi:hypothetical protein